jgi:hypothetical protein
MAIWSIFRPFGIFYVNLVKFVVIWFYVSRLGIGIVPRKIWQPWRLLIMIITAISEGTPNEMKKVISSNPTISYFNEA